MNISEVHSYSEKMTKEIKKVIVGKEELITLIVTALFANGHVLLDRNRESNRNYGNVSFAGSTVRPFFDEAGYGNNVQGRRTFSDGTVC